MGERSAIDSRDYIVAFELYSPEDCPPDFHLPPSLACFDAGLFLPRDDPDWLGRSSYAPRLLLLARDRLCVIPHPASRESVCECPMDCISTVEVGHMLLKGWLRLAGEEVSCSVRYNTRGFRAISRFLSRLRERLLYESGEGAMPEASLGGDLDIKFGGAFSRELQRGETVGPRLFHPPRVIKKRTLMILRRHHLAGDLLVKTDRRLLWITDRDRGFHSPYGSVVSYAPLRAVKGIDVAEDGGGGVLSVRLSGAPPWRIPVMSGNEAQATEFTIRAAIGVKHCGPASLQAG
jgi:hypothetical protein